MELRSPGACRTFVPPAPLLRPSAVLIAASLRVTPGMTVTILTPMTPQGTPRCVPWSAPSARPARPAPTVNDAAATRASVMALDLTWTVATRLSAATGADQHIAG